MGGECGPPPDASGMVVLRGSQITGMLKLHQQGSPLHTEPEAGLRKGNFPAPGTGARFPGRMNCSVPVLWVQMGLPGQGARSSVFPARGV